MTHDLDFCWLVKYASSSEKSGDTSESRRKTPALPLLSCQMKAAMHATEMSTWINELGRTRTITYLKRCYELRREMFYSISVQK